MTSKELQTLKNNDFSIFSGLHIEPENITKVTKLSGGRNNRIYEVRYENGKSEILKSYFDDQINLPSRFERETNFYSHLRKINCSLTPRLLEKNYSNQTVILSKINGSNVADYQINTNTIDQAVTFLKEINSESYAYDFWAKDALLSLDSLLEDINERIKALLFFLKEISNLEFEHFIYDKLLPIWETIKKTNIEGGASTLFQNRCFFLSPSDFGFHNAKINNGKLVFFDFEYSGMDDFAKLVCDFKWCPEYKNQFIYSDYFTSKLFSELRMDENFLARVNFLSPIFAIKWACIILNDFLPSYQSKRNWNCLEDKFHRQNSQLKKATGIINLLNRK